MIKEAFVSFEVAKLLKEKFFNERTPASYNENGEFQEGFGMWNKTPIYYSAPTQQMTMKWLRKVHNIFIEISVSIDLNSEYHYSYSILNRECQYVRKGYTCFDWNHEQATETAIKYCLENLI